MGTDMGLKPSSSSLFSDVDNVCSNLERFGGMWEAEADLTLAVAASLAIREEGPGGHTPGPNLVLAIFVGEGGGE